MSTMIALFLVFAALVGCAGETGVNVKNAPPPSAALTFAVETERYEETVRDADGAVLAECSYELPVLRALREDGTVLDTAGTEDQARALAVAETFNARFAQWKTNPKTLAESAKEDRAFRNESGLDPVAYTDNLSCAVYQTETLISVSGGYSTYTGGAHPNTLLLGWNFDLESGAFFDAATLDDETGFHDAVVRSLKAQAAARARENGLAPRKFFWEDYEDTLDNWSSYAVSFDEAGMSVMFSPYELAAYAAGPQVFRIPYEDLAPCLGSRGRTLLGLE